MANLTIAIDEDVLRRARLRALEAGTSVNALLRSYLETYVGSEAMGIRKSIVEQADSALTEVGQRDWARDELHR